MQGAKTENQKELFDYCFYPIDTASSVTDQKKREMRKPDA